MTSQINSGLIDTQYPQQGKDNPSQGMRDNFKNTALNFTYAAQEINDLQSKAVLKAALDGQTLSNDMQGSLLANAQLQGVTETLVSHGTQSGTITFSYTAGQYHTVTTNSAINVALSDWPILGIQGSITIAITIASVAHTVTFPNQVTIGDAGVIGLNSSSNIFTAPVTGVYTFTLTSYDGGFNYTLIDANTALRPFNSSSESITSGSAASLGKTTSYMTTTSASTATLAAGVEGQIKTFALYQFGGALVITVALAGWKTGATGTITLGAVGATATLKVIGGRWFCIGQVGAVFA